MRFELIDKILEFEKNKRIVGVKGISVEADNFAPFSSESRIYPTTLCLESLAQVGGWLTSASLDFAYLPVLGMISEAEIYKEVRAGDNLLVKAELTELLDIHSIIKGEIWRGEELIVSVRRMVYGLIELNDRQFIENQESFFHRL